MKSGTPPLIIGLSRLKDENYPRSFNQLIKWSFKLNIFYYGLDTQIPHLVFNAWFFLYTSK